LWCALGSVPLLPGQGLSQASANESLASVGSSDASRNPSTHAKPPLGFSADPYWLDHSRAADRYTTSDNGSIPHGVMGATIGGIAGGAIGYLRMLMYCENRGQCDATRDVLTGAAIGAVIGVVVEYFIRNGQR
jgi:hypothetical protein